MALTEISILVERARTGGYALGYFESWNLESLQGVLDAAEATQSPIIIGFNGDFLSRESRRAEENLGVYAAMGRTIAEAAKVPCGFIFNECPQDEWVRKAVDTGFNLVMPADPEAPYEEYVQRVKSIVEYAHARGVAVEAEIGELPCGASGEVLDNGAMTDPETAAQFVDATDIDLLAVSVGNVHIMVQGEQDLDLKQLEAIRARVDTPLVLHGGSGITSDSLKKAIALGVVKVNYGTYVKQRYLLAVRGALGNEAAGPHELLGIGGPEDAMVIGRLAVRDAVLERIHLLGCCSKA